MPSPKLSFIVITQNRRRELNAALESIRAQTFEDREVIVVVNGDEAETEALLRESFPEVRAHTLPENLGVGGGRNTGIELAGGDVLFFLDDDAELPDATAAERALEHFADPTIGIVSLMMIASDTGAPERRCIPFRDKRLREGVTDAAYFCGGACLIRREVFDRVGPFDAGLFYDGEELDLSYRALDAGYRILYDPSIGVRHHSSREGWAALTLPYYVRNRPWIALRHLPLPCFLTHCLGWWTLGIVRGAQLGVLGPVLRAIGRSIAAMPAVLKTRRPISAPTRRLLSRFSGRLWY